MSKRGLVLAGMAAGALWALAMIPLARAVSRSVTLPMLEGLALGLLPAGLVLLAMIGRLAQRRFFDDALIDGAHFPTGSGGDIDHRVLRNTAEQSVLALLLWPFIALVLGAGVLIALGLSFAVSRMLFWIGYHVSPPLRAFGFAAGFYPTIALLVLALMIAWEQGRFALS